MSAETKDTKKDAEKPKPVICPVAGKAPSAEVCGGCNQVDDCDHSKAE